jgi:hypothetical protein
LTDLRKNFYFEIIFSGDDLAENLNRKGNSLRTAVAVLVTETLLWQEMEKQDYLVPSSTKKKNKFRCPHCRERFFTPEFRDTHALSWCHKRPLGDGEQQKQQFGEGNRDTKVIMSEKEEKNHERNMREVVNNLNLMLNSTQPSNGDASLVEDQKKEQSEPTKKTKFSCQFCQELFLTERYRDRHTTNCRKKTQQPTPIATPKNAKKQRSIATPNSNDLRDIAISLTKQLLSVHTTPSAPSAATGAATRQTTAVVGMVFSCPHPSCSNKQFKSENALKNHLKDSHRSQYTTFASASSSSGLAGLNLNRLLLTADSPSLASSENSKISSSTPFTVATSPIDPPSTTVIYQCNLPDCSATFRSKMNFFHHLKLTHQLIEISEEMIPHFMSPHPPPQLLPLQSVTLGTGTGAAARSQRTEQQQQQQRDLRDQMNLPTTPSHEYSNGHHHTPYINLLPSSPSTPERPSSSPSAPTLSTPSASGSLSAAQYYSISLCCAVNNCHKQFPSKARLFDHLHDAHHITLPRQWISEPHPPPSSSASLFSASPSAPPSPSPSPSPASVPSPHRTKTSSSYRCLWCDLSFLSEQQRESHCKGCSQKPSADTVLRLLLVTLDGLGMGGTSSVDNTPQKPSSSASTSASSSVAGGGGVGGSVSGGLLSEEAQERIRLKEKRKSLRNSITPADEALLRLSRTSTALPPPPPLPVPVPLSSPAAERGRGRGRGASGEGVAAAGAGGGEGESRKILSTLFDEIDSGNASEEEHKNQSHSHGEGSSEEEGQGESSDEEGQEGDDEDWEDEDDYSSDEDEDSHYGHLPSLQQLVPFHTLHETGAGAGAGAESSLNSRKMRMTTPLMKMKILTMVIFPLCNNLFLSTLSTRLELALEQRVV